MIMKKTVLLTGATGNLGRAVTEHLQEKDYHIYAAVRAGGRLTATATLTPSVVDLSDEVAAASFVRNGLETFGHIPHAVLTVGGFAMGHARDTSATDIEKMIQINFYSAWHIIHPLYRAMEEKGFGRIVLIGARPGLEPDGGSAMLAYTLSKSLLFSLAGALNAESRQSGVITSVIVPSVIDTPANRRAMPDADFSAWVTPRAIAEITAFALESRDLREPLFKVYGKL